MELCDENRGFKPKSPYSRSVLKVPEDDFPVVSGAQKIAVVCRPAQRLYLAHMTFQFSRDTISLDVENSNLSIKLDI